MLRIVVAFFLLLPFSVFSQYALSPLNEGHRTMVDARFQTGQRIAPTSFAPYLIPIDTLEAYTSQGTKRWSHKEHESWVLRKIFTEHLAEIEKKDFKLYLDPVFNLQAFGQSDDQGRRLFTNSRGLRVQGALGKRVFFATDFYENQAILPTYLDSVVNERTSVPGYGRVKDFNTSTTYDYDYQLATGYIGYAINDHSFIQFGHDKHFVGYGNRSLFLADGAAPYPFLRFSFSMLKNKISFSSTYAMRQQQQRVAPNYNNKEALFSRDYWRFTVIELVPWHWMHLSFLHSSGIENNAWWNYLPGSSQFMDTPFPDNLGLNLGVGPFKGANMYGQLLSTGDEIAYQVGAKYFREVFAFRLTALLEFNHLDLYTYHTRGLNGNNPADEQFHYTHTAQYLGHTVGDGLDEILMRIRFSWKEVFMQTNIHYLEMDQRLDLETGQTIPIREVFIVNTEIGYQFNTKTNMQLLVGYTNRNELRSGANTFNNYTYVGFRTRLVNDFNIF